MKCNTFLGFAERECVVEDVQSDIQSEYINFSGASGMMSRPQAREDGWNCLACLHTNVFGRIMLVEKKGNCLLAWYPLGFFEM